VSPADAEDALQDLFLKLSTGRVSRPRDLRAYLFTAARREALDVLRRRKRERPLGERDLVHQEVGVCGSAAPPGANGQGSEEVHHWRELLGRLPLEQREVIALKVWEEMTFAQIAKVVGISPNTAMSRYRYGIERLRGWCRGGEELA
jgi:RNA polymerase sigma-70 factor (ECF subfamily)